MSKLNLVLRVSSMVLLIVVSTHRLFAQSEEGVFINNFLFTNGIIDYTGELYKINDRQSAFDNRLFFQSELASGDVIKVDLGLTYSSIDEDRYIDLSDTYLSYQRNFETSKRNRAGFQGVGAIMKLIIPTGTDSVLSGFDSWGVEPLVGVLWFIGPKMIQIGGQFRYNYSFAAKEGSDPRFSFYRTDLFIGFENKRFWSFLELDHRFIPEYQRSNVFLFVDLAYKLNKQIGIKLGVKPALKGSDFYENLLSLGAYARL